MLVCQKRISVYKHGVIDSVKWYKYPVSTVEIPTFTQIICDYKKKWTKINLHVIVIGVLDYCSGRYIQHMQIITEVKGLNLLLN